MNPQFVFLSHASVDKPRIKFVSDALIEAGFKLWCDQPLGLGYKPDEVDAHFIRLHAGDDWNAELAEALRSAVCVVACLSKAVLEPKHQVFRDEIAAARILKKLLPCRIDPDLSPNDLQLSLAGQHIADVSKGDEMSLKLLVSDVRRLIESANQRNLSLGRIRDVFAPFLIDRRNQEDGAAKAMLQALRSQPQALIVQGPKNECLDEFWERLKRDTSPRCLPDEQSWNSVITEWPRETGDRFKASYARSLALTLRSPPQNVLSRLNRDRPTGVVSWVPLGSWDAKQKDRIAAWLSWWHEAHLSAGGLKVIPVLMIEFPPASPSWKKIPPGRENGIPVSRAIKDTLSVARRLSSSKTHLPLQVLDTLNPVSHHDAADWLRRTLEGPSDPAWASFERCISALFEAEKRQPKRVSLLDFSRATTGLFRPSSDPQELEP